MRFLFKMVLAPVSLFVAFLALMAKWLLTLSSYVVAPLMLYIFGCGMDELNPTIKERQIYHEMKLTPAMVKSIRTLCGVCLRHYVETKAFKIAIVPNKDRCMETCTVCQTRRGYDYVVMPR